MFDTESWDAKALPLGDAQLDLDDALLERLPVGVYACDGQGVIVRFNRKATELWGRSPRPGDPAERFCGAHRLFWPEGQPLGLPDMPMAEAIRSGRCFENLELQLEQPGGRRLWILLNIAPLRDDTDAITGAIACFQDITAARRATEARYQSERRLRDMLEALPSAVYTTDAAGRITFYNRAAIDLSGRRPELGSEQWCITWRLYRPDGSPLPHDQCPMAVALKEDRPVWGAEITAERPDGTRVPVIAYPTPLHDDEGRLIGAVNMLLDISERQQAEERRRLLTHELNHRVKNTLAAVQSIATQSFRGERPSPAHQRFVGRLAALATAHDVLTRENWEGASLGDIALQASTLLCDQPESRFEIVGPTLRMKPNMALAFAMALHELCTNAAKYGALSNPTGRVRIAWKVVKNDVGRHLHLQWAESGGPPVQAPLRRGFGSRLIENGLAHQLGAQVRLDFPASGVTCDIKAPLP